ncbi:Asp-tRNA(Asn)/Glu-tRNA(Gln) amidotransferase subunit GatC [Oceanobacillus alkalisoli]|uniref:Asp-tRNA(Asn)/Glu-tRNA(Gln) amidotransferase subunit GatC n=1 Tax=Oceanobacillus alkalisoli TaxID=2925113 RepID=UPI001EF04257|nr:Asp-tRNA(Asn)/Glu-tRNA(Gln) amidotransferase subunit GatC [Oceanobacillus alkalisoli]MCF3944934.1 Asp-tRNA(Asn)/Glu-tRNA(Gln) amidotransferase subunit GatC [Oceanobacillus alkalisoli]MCG5104153.1 Asp-tRNA(Asn)/Glu-tRNA(Gln) amidotransferase subunit GatC [Oceanobacillus alkalisoli]
MADNISKERVMHVADLARLHITDEEAEKLAEELQSIIKHAEQLTELDTTNVEPTTHVIHLENVMRKDEPRTDWITQEEALKNAPDHKDGQFRVPSILSE